MEVVVLGREGSDVGPCVLLTTARKSWLSSTYLFNCPEGLARGCLEHKLMRPSSGSLKALFLTRRDPAASAGVAALILRLSADGGGKTEVVGPPGTASALHALRHFVSWKHPQLVVTEAGRAEAVAAVGAGGEGGLGQAPAVYQDEVVRVEVLQDSRSPPASGTEGHRPKRRRVEHVQPAKCAPPRWRQHEHHQQHPHQQHQHQQHQNPLFWRGPRHDGKDPPPVPVSAALGGGVGCQMEVHAQTFGYVCDVASGALLVVLDCPTASCLDRALSLPQLRSLVAHSEGRKVCVVHFSPREVLQAARYQAWLAELHAADHLLLHGEPNPSCPLHGSTARLLCSAARLSSRLSAAFPRQFVSCGCVAADAPDPGLFGLTLTATSAAQLSVPDAEAEGEVGVGVEPRTYRLPAGFDSNEHAARLLRDSLLESESSSKGDADADLLLNIPRVVSEASDRELEVAMLGTGCAEPSKTRGNTSIWLNLFERGGFLLDVGECTLSKLRQMYGEARAGEIVGALECVWVSHRHADHCAGLLSLLAERHGMRVRSGQPASPLLVICPKPVQSWVEEGLRAFGLDVASVCELHHFKQFNALMSGAGARHRALEALQLESLVSIAVEHCWDSYGVIIRSRRGWQVAFSGDTRPSTRFAEAAVGSTLLIHEATFEDSASGHAQRKKHSTVSEALRIAGRCRAYRVLLTHFSQRSPRLPGLPKGNELAVARRACIVAFDGMCINLRDLPQLPRSVADLRTFFQSRGKGSGRPGKGVGAQPPQPAAPKKMPAKLTPTHTIFED